jgi:hypothetical protein
MRKKPHPAQSKGTALAGSAMSAVAAAPAKHRFSANERAILRDIWAYAIGLAVVAAIVGLLLTGFSWHILVPVGLVCGLGAVLLSVATLERFSRAHRNGTVPDTSRIFE